MNLSAITKWLLPADAERDEAFQQEILSPAHSGLQILAIVETGVGLISFGASVPMIASILLLAIGILTIAATRVYRLYEHSRLVGVVSCILTAVVAARAMAYAKDADFVLGAIAVLVLTAAAALPLQPLQTFAAGAVALAASFDSHHLLFLGMVNIAATAITAALYEQRRNHYLSYVRVLDASNEVRSLQSRLIVAENSNTMVRLFAALAHELSQPVGTVSSAIDTLLLICARQSTAPPQDQPRLSAMQQDLGQGLKTSMERLRKMVTRIQKLTQLDEAGARSASINELLSEAVEIVRTNAQEAARIESDLQPLPDLNCRPQQLIAVFTSLLSNSLEATPPGGEIHVSSRRLGDRLEIQIRDNGRGIPQDRLAHIFDPGFQVSDGRVATGNWSLFTSRQLIKDHGGDMKIQSQPGKGTTVSLFLPCSS